LEKAAPFPKLNIGIKNTQLFEIKVKNTKVSGDSIIEVEKSIQ
jgi:hypothetical protein